MSYRRVARSYRRSIARRYRQLEERPRARLGAIVALAVAVLGVTGGMLISSYSAHISSANLASSCITSVAPAAAGGATPGAADSVAAATPAATAEPTTTATAAPAAAPAAPAAPTPTTTICTSATATAAATPTPAVPAAVNVSCDIIVPANPLTAQGLATPYQLTGTDGATPAASGCEMSNAANLGAFVQATILNPRNGALSVYDPLVITQGTTPAVAPTVPVIPADSVVTIDFGFNGADLYQVGATPAALEQGNCVNGLPGSIFGQVSFCNGTAFFAAAYLDESIGILGVPSQGISPKTGQACPVTRNFNMVDQDPSDNVTTEYLETPNGDTAQDTTSNADNLTGATLLLNGSDNTLLDTFLDPVLGCIPFEAPDLANNDMPTSSQAMDELLANRNQPRAAALVPEDDEMVLNNDAFDPAKTNLYREEIGQAPINWANSRSASPAMFCQNMINIQTPFLATNQALLATGPSPVTAVGDNLLTFMANRLNMSFTNLACQNFGLTQPVTVTLNAAGAAVAATFNTAPQTATNTATRGMPGGMPGWGQRRGRQHHRMDNPSGM
jgi:hypothetical protein